MQHRHRLGQWGGIEKGQNDIRYPTPDQPETRPETQDKSMPHLRLIHVPHDILADSEITQLDEGQLPLRDGQKHIAQLYVSQQLPPPVAEVHLAVQ